MKALCKKTYTGVGHGCDSGSGFIFDQYYTIHSMYKNKGHKLMITFLDNYNDMFELPLSEAEEIFDFTEGIE